MRRMVNMGIAISADGEHLIVPRGFPEGLKHELMASRTRILIELRASQMDAAGFYTTIPEALRSELLASPYVALSVMSTGPAVSSPPIRIAAHSRIGMQSWMEYRADHPSAIARTRSRMRALTVFTESLGVCAWDLDALSPNEREKLIAACIANKVIVSNDAAADLSWLFSHSRARPRYLIDTMLLVRQVKPEILQTFFKRVVLGNDQDKEHSRKLLRREDGRPTATPETVAAALRLAAPEMRYREHSAWCVTELSERHRAFVSDYLKLSLQIVASLVPNTTATELPNALRRQYPWYAPYSTATIRLAEASLLGMPFDEPAALRLKQDLRTNIESAAKALSKFPGFKDLVEQLSNPHAGDTYEIKQALAGHSELRHSAAVDSDQDPGIENDHFEEELAPQPSCVNELFASLRLAKKHYGMVTDYLKAAVYDGRLHSHLNFDTATGRSSSSKPNLQSIPQDRLYRGLIKASPGHVILSADYAAIELRIAAVLAQRAIKDLRGQLKTFGYDDWFLGRVHAGLSAQETLIYPQVPKREDLDWYNVAIPAVAQKVLKKETQTMMAAFRGGLDPHLLTAMEMASRKGTLTLTRSPKDLLLSMNQDERAALKDRLSLERQGAKATNFGLLYGMDSAGLHRNGISQFGLAWTHEEAVSARAAWFDLYPEFRMWHFWTQFCNSRRLDKGSCAKWDWKSSQPIIPEYSIRHFRVLSLTGRPFSLLDDRKQAVNYQDQGSCADILSRAIAWLPAEVASMMLLPVHDELVFEVPRSELECVRKTIEQVMSDSANEVLDGEIPIVIEIAVGETWT